MSETISASGVNGQVEFDGQWVTITRKGAMARMTVGKGEKRIPVATITAVQWKPPGPLVRGFIQFTVPGGNESRSRMGRQTKDAAGDENSVVVANGQKAEFDVLRQAIEAAIGARYASAQASAPAPSVGDEIAKLAQLHTSGVLSAEEFAAAKARLIGS